MCIKRKEEKARVEEQNSKKGIKTNVHACSERELRVVKFCCVSCFTCPIGRHKVPTGPTLTSNKFQTHC